MKEKNIVYVIVPLYNRFENVSRLCNQLKSQTFQDYQLILIDHGPEKLQKDMLCDSVIYLEGRPTDWWTGAINVGLRYVFEDLKVSDSCFVLLQNDDVIFGPDLLGGLISAQRRNPQSVVSAITLKTDTWQILDAHNKLSFWIGKHRSPLKGKHINSVNEDLLQSDVLKGRGVLYPAHALRAIGYADERLHYRGDTELSFRATKAGYNLYVVPAVKVRTLQNSQEGARRRRGWAFFLDYVFAKRSTQNLPAAWYYFKNCFGPVFFLIPFTVHSIRTIFVGLVIAVKG